MIGPNDYTANEIEKVKREISELNVKLKILQQAYGDMPTYRGIHGYCHCYPRGNNRVGACEICGLEQVRFIQTF